MVYDAQNYWENRLTENFSLLGVGHQGFSDSYNQWLYKAKIRALRKALAGQNLDVPNQTVCDLGCGTGFFVEFYTQAGVKSLSGIDITHKSIAHLKQKYRQHSFLVSNLAEPSLLITIERKFDIVNVFDVIYHITDDAIFHQAIANICSLTHPQGHIFITDHCGEKDFCVAEHVKWRSQEKYRQVFQENDAEIIAIYPLYFLLNRPIFGKIKNSKLRQAAGKLDNFLAPLYYFLDGLLMSLTHCNLKLIVAKKNQKPNNQIQ